MKRPVKPNVKQTTERRISASLRIALAVVLLAVNVLAVILLARFLQEHAAIVFTAMEVVAVMVAVNIQSSSRAASYKLAWTMLVVALPVAGIILYVLWGGNIQSKKLTLLPIKAPACRGAELRQSQVNLERLGQALPNWRRVATGLQRRDFLLCRDTAVTYFPSGEAFFADLLPRLAGAQDFIFLEFFILAEGKLWDRMMEILVDRSRHGVEVKVIFDDFGNIKRMHAGTIEKMRAAGIEVHIFNPVHHYVNRLYFNYRDHRKIVCVDGQYAYTGGVNVADEYAGFVRRFGEWKDSGILLDGPGAWGLTSRFIHMWEMLGQRLNAEHDYYRPLEERAARGWCQSFTDGPINNPDNPAEDLFLQCIAHAQSHIWLTTPYFAVEDSMVHALCMAALSGVDVRLCLPGVWDHRYTKIVAGSYYETLLASGVKIYHYTPGFLHAKSFLADDEVAMVGTVNMDYRSFQLHYENGVMLYGCDAILELRRDMEGIMARSEPVDGEAWKNRSKFRKVMERVLKIFSIWM